MDQHHAFQDSIIAVDRRAAFIRRAAIKFHIVLVPTAVKLREAISELLALAVILKRALPAGADEQRL